MIYSQHPRFAGVVSTDETHDRPQRLAGGRGPSLLLKKEGGNGGDRDPEFAVGP